MKKISVIFISILVANFAYAQNNPAVGNQVINLSAPLHQLGDNEIRFNLASAIAGLPEFNYERFVSDNAGIGIAMAVSLEKPETMTTRSEFMPYGRIYFGDRKASGFYIEANMAMIGQREVYNDLNYSVSPPTLVPVDNKAICFGMGGAVGAKLLTRNGFVGEIYLGGGRVFGKALVEGYPRVGFSIGKRF